MKYNLKSINVHLLKPKLLIMEKWRTVCHEGTKNFEKSRLVHLLDLKSIIMIGSNPKTCSTQNLVICTKCGLMCKSAAGLKCHLRHNQTKRSEKPSYIELIGEFIKYILLIFSCNICFRCHNGQYTTEILKSLRYFKSPKASESVLNEQMQIQWTQWIRMKQYLTVLPETV